ncbi:MAG: family 43 glycosylhydrolase [Bacteroidaceae bacterium]|nr:family 43 glycosylhydrolase [Bacteroidaceae bacterium]
MKGRTLILALLLFLPLTIMAEGGKSQVPLADPYILLDGDTYYAYGTNDANGIRCYTSNDLRLWKYEGLALNKSNTTETQWFWAPEVYHIGDKYIMYYSANEHLFAATATSPKGPFVQVGSYQMESLIGNEKCIDSHVFFDVKTNGDTIAYIFFVRFNDGNCIWQAKLGDDFITPVAGTLRKCFAASQSWELIQGRVNEGPNVIKYRNTYFLTYSGNDYRCQDYAVGYATTTNIASGTWTKFSSNPILRRWDDLVGTGHHSLFYDKEGNLRIVFHAHNSTESVQTRLMYIGTMKFQTNKLVMLNDPIIRPTLSTSAPYSPELITQKWGFQDGGAVTVDLNNDGNQDIVTGGFGNTVQNSATDEDTSKRMSYLAQFSSTTHKWTKVSTAPPFQVADYPSIIPCDINNDGNMDIIAFEQTGYDITEEAYTGNFGHEGIFLGKGNGTFEEVELQLPFDIKAPCNAEVIDIDNDGRLDIILVGHQGETNCNIILHNQSTDASNLSFTVEPFEEEFLLREAIIQPADFNNDGFQDFAISALVDEMEGQLRFTDVYLNNPEEHGKFIRLGLGEKGANIKRKSNGALQVADFNDDGWLDIMLSGLGEQSSGESATRQRIYLNKKTEVPSFSAISCDFQTDTYTLSSAASNSAGVIDWDGDGTYDILIGGKKSNVYGGMLYLNDGQGRLKRNVAIPGATGACITFPDYNGDGRKDFLLCGLSMDNNYLTSAQQGRNAILCYNLYPIPSQPDAPLAPTFDKQGNFVTLSWQAPESAHPGFTYEIFIKDENGDLINSTPAFIGSTKDGVRKVNRLGRVGCMTEWKFFPTKPGTYTWGVQTVDAAYTGSVFTEGPQFTVTEADITTDLKDLRNQATKSLIYNLAGQHLSKPHKGINIINNHKTTIKTLKQ